MSSTYISGQITVVNPEFCTPNLVDIIIKKQLFTLSKHKYSVTDAVNGNLLFGVVTKNFFGFHTRRSLLDTAGNTILTLQQSSMSLHSRWEVFRGDSTEYKNLLFSVKRHSIFQVKTEYDVFMAGNTDEAAGSCDFKIGKKEIYAGNTRNVAIAQMHKPLGFMSNKFPVTVYPHVDCAFIVALVVVLEEITSSPKQSSNQSQAQAGTYEA